MVILAFGDISIYHDHRSLVLRNKIVVNEPLIKSLWNILCQTNKNQKWPILVSIWNWDFHSYWHKNTAFLFLCFYYSCFMSHQSRQHFANQSVCWLLYKQANKFWNSFDSINFNFISSLSRTEFFHDFSVKREKWSLTGDVEGSFPLAQFISGTFSGSLVSQ